MAGNTARTRLVGALLAREGRILLGRRSPEARTFAGMWDVIGGHVETGETYEEGLLREVQEEVGVRAMSFRRLAERQLSETREFRIYKVDAWEGGEPRIANHEHIALAWFTIEEACNLPDLASGEFVSLFRGLTADAPSNDMMNARI